MNAFDYAPAPFWILNHRLERAEMARQIKLIKDSGSSGFFLHARDGMLTPYGSKEWFDCVKFAVDEAKKHGMKAWLYDEDAWPSGNAGGLITAQYPEVIAKTLVIKKLVPDEKGIVKAPLDRDAFSRPSKSCATRTDGSSKSPTWPMRSEASESFFSVWNAITAMCARTTSSTMSGPEPTSLI
jgi:hypothetical protein